MAEILTKPIEQWQKDAFLIEHNHKQNKRVYETDVALYALEPWELLDGDTVVDNSKEYNKEMINKREITFKQTFFEIPAVGTIFKGGWYRKQPKGYSSATESINTAFNLVNMMGALPKDSLIFYTKPDFSNEEQCSEEWLIENQFRNEAWSKEDFAQFYYAFVTGWNAQEHT